MMDQPAIVIRHDAGGVVSEYLERALRYKRGDVVVAIVDDCMSACTLYTMVPRVCVKPTARLGFHLPVQNLPGKDGAFAGSKSYGGVLMSLYPDVVRKWIESKGGLTDDMLILRGSELLGVLPMCKLGVGL